MTTGRAAELLREPGDPRRATFLELFFDLVYVFALLRISQRMVADLTSNGDAVERRIVVSEIGETLLLLLALYWVWAVTAGITDRFDPARPEIQLIVVGTMFGTLVMAAALPLAFSDTGLVFATAYVAIQIGRGLVLLLGLRGHELRRDAIRLLFWSAASAGPWITGALLPEGTGRGALWTLAVVVDFTAVVLRYPTPGLGRLPVSAYPVVAEHLSERYRQFFIIALGGLILAIGLAYSGDGFEANQTAAVVVAFATAVLLWRIYIYRAGELLPAAIGAAPEPVRLARSASYAHLLMVFGIVAVAVGAEIFIVHPFGSAYWAWTAVILGGPALFLAGREVLSYAVFGRVSRARLIGLGVLVAVAPAMSFVPPLIAATAAALVLAGIAVSDAVRIRRHPKPVSPPR